MAAILIERILDNFSSSGAPDQIWKTFLEAVSEFQFEEIGYQLVPKTSSDVAKPELRSNQELHPWALRSVQEDLYLRSPFIREAAQTGKIVDWETVRKRSEKSEDYQFIIARDSSGVSKNGVTIPVFGPFERDGFFSIGYGDAENRPDQKKLSVIQMLAQAAHQKIATLIGTPLVLSSRLSERERIVVRLISRGLSNKQIAREIGVSPHTVQTFVRRAFEKLNVRDRVSAVTEFQKLGYI